MKDVGLTTPRLRLRLWREDDLDAFARLNADPRVMEFMATPLPRDASDALAARLRAHFDAHGFGPWAVEEKEGLSFIGFIGLSIPRATFPFSPCVEIGWRLAAGSWGYGYATEGARAAMAHGFGACGLQEIVSFTTESNVRSRRVMEKLGMTRNPADDFDHPLLDAAHPLRRHVLYRRSRSYS